MQLFMQTIVSGVLNAGIYALVAAGLTLIFGVTNVVNFAHGALLMLAMYQSYWLFTLWGIHPYLSLFINIPVFFVVGFLMQKYLIEDTLGKPHYVQLLLTLGIMMVIENAAMIMWGPNPRVVNITMPPSLIIGGVVATAPRIIAFMVALLLTVLLYGILYRTDLGRQIRAASQDGEKALTIGINVRYVYSVAFGIGVALVGAAGALVVPFLYAQPYIGNTFLLTSFIIVIIGGLGSFNGALLGGLLVGLIEALGTIIIPGTLYMLLPLAVFIIALLLRPKGIMEV